jgi:hypothetical protein
VVGKPWSQVSYREARSSSPELKVLVHDVRDLCADGLHGGASDAVQDTDTEGVVVQGDHDLGAIALCLAERTKDRVERK